MTSLSDLRTRIAAAIHAKEYPQRCDPQRCEHCSEPPSSWSYVLADAVIRELNLDISHTYKTSQGREVCIEGFWTEEATDGTA